MKKTLTDIVMVIDRSTSMRSLIESTIEGYNAFIEEQKKAAGDARVTLVLFDSDSELVYEGMPINEVPDLDRETYFVQGMTAMNDAVAFAITGLENKISNSSEDQKPTDVIFAIITDGMENSSKEFQGRSGTVKIKEMIEKCKSEKDWQFVFLASNIDVAAVGSSYSINKSSNFSYDSTSIGTDHMYKTLSKAATRFRAMKSLDVGTATLNFDDLDDEKEDKNA